MFSSRNMKCITKLAIKNFKNSRIRNIVTIIAIIFTTILFTSLITIGIGAVESIKLAMQIQKGSKSDIEIRYMSEEQFGKLAQIDNIKKYGCRMPIGFLENSNTYNIELDYMDPVEQELTFNQPSIGNAPIKQNEIATTDKALRSLGIEPEIGKTVTISIKIKDIIYEYDMIVSGWWETTNSQAGVMLVSQEFIRENKDILSNTYKKDKDIAGTYFTDIILKSDRNASVQLIEVIELLGGDPGNQSAENYLPGTVNRATNPRLDSTAVLAVIVFIILFILAGYLLIYNIFEISIMQDVRHYGLLKTIGMTQKQIGYLVRLQAIWLLLIGIPIGLVCGFLIGKIVLPLALGIVGSQYKNMIVSVSPNPIIFIIAVLFTIFTVFLSIRKPTHIAADISPIDAIRYLDGKNKKITSKIKKTKKFTIGRFAKNNFLRNKKRSLFIIISMMLCCVLVNSAVVVVSSIDIKNFIKTESSADIIIANSNTFNNLKGFSHYDDALAEEDIQYIEQNFTIENAGRIYKNTLDDKVITIDYGADLGTQIATEKNGTTVAYGGNYRITLGNDGYPLCNTYGIEKNIFDRLNIINSKSNMSSEEIYHLMSQGQYVIEVLRNSTNRTVEQEFKCSIGQKVYVNANGGKQEFEIVAQAYASAAECEVPYISTSNMLVGGDSPNFYFLKDQFTEIYKKPVLMSYIFDVPDDELKLVDLQIRKYVEEKSDRLGYSSVVVLEDGMNSIRNTVLVAGSIIGIILGSAGLLNFINLMITNAITRKKEFAVMQSIGMTTKQLTDLITREGIIYSVISGLAGIFLSWFFGVTLIKNICSSSYMFSFKLLIWPACGVSLIIIIFSAILPVIIIKCFNKGSVVERLGKSI